MRRLSAKVPAYGRIVTIRPDKTVKIKPALYGWLDRREIGRDVEVSRRVERVVADVVNFHQAK